MVLTWQCVATEPGAATGPAELGPRWDDGFDLPAAGTIAATRSAAGLPHCDVDAFDWWARARVTGPRARLGGLTAPAEVFVDGRPIDQQPTSMFLPVDLELADDAEHEVVVVFRSVAEWLRTRRPRGRWRSALVAEQGLRWLRASLVGRAAAYGGGVVPPPVGPWRGVAAGAPPPRISVSPDGVISAPGVELTVFAPDGTVCATGDGVARVAEPRLWWPRGYGEQPLYRLVLTAPCGTRSERLVGFRSVAMVWADGRPHIEVNGARVFCRGGVWLADPAASSDEVAAEVDQLADAGATMLRVPGGTAYEGLEFYDRCAARGVLVWQDAMVATFDVPAELHGVIADELRAFLDQCGHSPALAVVCGGSETVQQPEMLGVPADRRSQPLVEELLRGVDSPVPYVVSSPWSPDGRLSMNPHVGFTHWFAVGGYLRPQSRVFAASVSFATETLAFAVSSDGATTGPGDWAPSGYHGSTWDFQSIHDHYISEVFEHQSAPALLRRTEPEQYEELSRCMVAEIMTAMFKHWRRPYAQCGGALVLSAQDLYPHSGWGLLDAAGAAKAPLRALRRVWAPRAVCVADDGMAGVQIDLHNDTPADVAGSLVLVAVRGSGTEVARGELAITVPARTTTTLHDFDVTGQFADLNHMYKFGPPTADAVDVRWLAVPDDSGERELIARDVHIVVPRPGAAAPGWSCVVKDEPEGPVVELMSRTVLRYVRLTVPGYRPGDDYFHLAPGVPYCVPLRAQNPDSAPPRGTASSVDTPDILRVG